jgi:hypothetical protein
VGSNQVSLILVFIKKKGGSFDPPQFTSDSRGRTSIPMSKVLDR